MGNFAFIRNNNMKMGQLNNSGRHNERINKNYSNTEIDKTKSKENYHFKEPQGSYEKTFWKIKEDNNYLGNLRLQGNKQSNVACEFIIDVNKEYFDKIGIEKTKQYYKDAYDFCVKKCGEKNIISATVHMDEGHPHMHVVYVPVVKGKDRKGQDCERINCSKFWEGKDSYRQLQDEFYQHIQERGYVDLQRGEFKDLTQKEHLTVDEYKMEQSKEKQLEFDRLNKIKSEIEPPEKKVYLPKDIEELKTLAKSANLQKWEMEQENRKLRVDISNLTKKVVKLEKGLEDLDTIVSKNKDFQRENTILKDYLQTNPKAHEELEGYFDKVAHLRHERKCLYQFKNAFLDNEKKVDNSQKVEVELRNEIGRQNYAVEDLGKMQHTIIRFQEDLEKELEKRKALEGVKNLFRRSEKKELDNSIIDCQKRLKMAENDLERVYKIEPLAINDEIKSRKIKLNSLIEKLDSQVNKTKEYAKLRDKAALGYKFIDVQSKCYEDYEREYVFSEAKKIHGNPIKEVKLERLNSKEKELIFNNIPKEFKAKAKEILDPPRTIKNIIKSHDFLER